MDKLSPEERENLRRYRALLKELKVLAESSVEIVNGLVEIRDLLRKSAMGEEEQKDV